MNPGGTMRIMNAAPMPGSAHFQARVKPNSPMHMPVMKMLGTKRRKFPSKRSCPNVVRRQMSTLIAVV